MLNVETIGGTIIEVHLRFTDQWPDHQARWVEAIVALYENGAWNFADADRREGYSVVLVRPERRALPPSAGGARRGDQMHARCH